MADDFKYRPKGLDIRIKPPGAKLKPEEKECEWAGCVSKGGCRAPKSPDRLRDFYYFCEQHAREYNKNWNFFSGMTDEDITEWQVGARHGHRPTWDVRKNTGERAKARKGANAGHLLANCAGDDKFFDLIHIQFKRQREILTSNDVKGEYVRLAKSAGMNEEEFEACMTNEEEIARLDKVVEDGFAAGVTGTPTFFLNGKKIAAYALEDFDKAIAEELGEPLPESSESPAETEGGEH